MRDIRTENIQTTIHSLNLDFAGRRNVDGYDETKPIHIHRRNRAFVWNKDMQLNCLDSMLKGYYIPPIICCSRFVNGVERREVMEGGNRITTFRRIMNKEIGDLTDDQCHKVCAHPITLVVMRNLTNTQQREMFRRLNKNVKVSDGQLYSMSEEDSPLVREALALLNDINYPLRALITEVFFDTVNKDNDGQKNLENAIVMVSGALNGVKFITKSFSRQEIKVEKQEPINRATIVHILGRVFNIFKLANQEEPLHNKTAQKAQFTVGTYIGPILYDIHTSDGSEDITRKWVKMIVAVRKGVVNAKDAIYVKGAQNITADKLKQKSYKVGIFVKEARLATEEELKQVKHIDCDDAEEEDEDEDDESGDDE